MGPGQPDALAPAPAGWGVGPTSVADLEALAVLTSVNGLGPVTMGALFAAIGSPAAVLRLAAERQGARAIAAAATNLESGRGLPTALPDAIVAAAGRRQEILGEVARLGLQLVAIGDPEYPSRLRAIEIPPLLLYVKGDPSAFVTVHAVAVVGTRRPSDAGRRIASRISGAVTRAGGLVVSGLAIGIDGAAHAAAVGEGRPTVAFIGSGHDRLFPATHDRRAEAIVETGGAIVSEYSPGTEPTRGTFPRRNRLISGSADAVVVVEAGARSGALLTASWALEQGRECFVVPGSIESPASAGCLGFLRDWPGLARVVSGVPQLLEDLGMAAEAGIEPATAPGRQRPSSTVRPIGTEAAIASVAAHDRPVAAALFNGAVTVDELVAITRQPVGAVLGALTRLEGAGFVEGRYGRYEVTARIELGADARPAA
ncbi:MAG TPA: DNA-processing protein DprA [Candidatus Limnocylindrales bacterium]|nr:DNA-processing protein DprA [Candidatus Limnocylindrales bacterium]